MKCPCPAIAMQADVTAAFEEGYLHGQRDLLNQLSGDQNMPLREEERGMH